MSKLFIAFAILTAIVGLVYLGLSLYLVASVALDNTVSNAAAIGWSTFALGILFLIMMFLFIIWAVIKSNKAAELAIKVRKYAISKLCGENQSCQRMSENLEQGELEKMSIAALAANLPASSPPMQASMQARASPPPMETRNVSFQRGVATLSPECRESLRALVG